MIMENSFLSHIYAVYIRHIFDNVICVIEEYATIFCILFQYCFLRCTFAKDISCKMI